MCTGLDDPCIKDIPENQLTVKKKTGAHMFQGIKLPQRRNGPPALTSPCAMQSVRPGKGHK